jgi:hypothetical protein
MELSDFFGTPAVKIATQGRFIPWIGVKAFDLLSDENIVKADRVAIEVGIINADPSDPEFWSVSGNIYIYAGEDNAESISPVGIHTEASNPKLLIARLTEPMAAGADNYFMFVPTQDDRTAYRGKNDIYILSVGFMDTDGNWIKTVFN